MSTETYHLKYLGLKIAKFDNELHICDQNWSEYFKLELKGISFSNLFGSIIYLFLYFLVATETRGPAKVCPCLLSLDEKLGRLTWNWEYKIIFDSWMDQEQVAIYFTGILVGIGIGINLAALLLEYNTSDDK